MAANGYRPSRVCPATQAGRGRFARTSTGTPMLTGSNLVHTREYNLRIVHEVIRLYGPLSRAEIARRTALTGQTVSNLVKDLVELGLVQEGERQRDGGRGAPSTALAVNPDGCYSVGLDFNRDHLTGVLVDLAGTARQRENVEFE